MNAPTIFYFDALRFFKSTLGGGSERRLITDEIRRMCESRKELNILDVGTGDGAYIAKILREFKQSKIVVTGLDPSRFAIDAFRRNMPTHVPAWNRFEDLKVDRISSTFDAVTCIQALYYIQDPRRAVSDFIDITKPGGAVIISLWSNTCALYQLHEKVFSRNGNTSPLSSEQVEAWVKTDHPKVSVKTLEFVGLVDFDPWRRNPVLCIAALAVLSREWRDEMKPAWEDLEALTSYLKAPLSEKRVNQVLVLSKNIAR